MTIVTIMCKLFTAMFLGFYLNKKKILDTDTTRSLSTIVVQYICPFLIISSVSSMSSGDGETVYFMLGGGVVLYLFLFLAGLLIVHLLKIEKGLKGVYLCFILFSNNAFMGFPLVQALFGTEAVFYTAILNMPFNILFFSLGLYLLGKDAGRVGAFQWKSLLNNGVIASILALLIYFSGIKLPMFVSETCSFVGNITMPLSMMLIGSGIGEYELDEIVKEKRLYVLSLFRFAVLPAVAYVVAQFFTKDAYILGIITITVAMPVASSVAMGAAQYDEQGRVASLGVAFTTLCSIVTIPILAVIFG